MMQTLVGRGRPTYNDVGESYREFLEARAHESDFRKELL